MQSREQRGYLENETAKGVLKKLDDIINTGDIVEAGIEETPSFDRMFIGSVSGYNQSNRISGGEAYMKDKTAVLPQGSFGFFPDGLINIVLSPDFSRCVGLIIEKPQGLIVAHSTEHDDSLLNIYQKLTNSEDVKITFFLPDVEVENSDITDSVREDLAKLTKSINNLANDHVKTVKYPWSDFSPSSGRDNEGYTLKVAKGLIEMIPTKLVDDETQMGYHHEFNAKMSH